MLFDTLPTAPGRQQQALTKVSLKMQAWVTIKNVFYSALGVNFISTAILNEHL